MTRVREPLLWITHILPGARVLKTILNGHFKALASGQAFDFIILLQHLVWWDSLHYNSSPLKVTSLHAWAGNFVTRAYCDVTSGQDKSYCYPCIL